MRNSSKAIWLGLAVVLLILGCKNPISGGSGPAEGGTLSTTAVSDGSSDGNDHFFFLPPVVKHVDTAAFGEFDGDLAPVVTVNEWSESGGYGAEIARFDTVSGSGSERLRVAHAPEDEFYIVNWHTGDSDQTVGDAIYRIRVLVDDYLLGYAEVVFVDNGREMKNARTNDLIPLKDGRTLPIKFRIDTGALPGGSLQAGGAYHTVTIKNGVLWAFGDNQYGQLGDGTQNAALSPLPVGDDSDWRSVDAGLYHNVAIKEDGTLWTWGYNFYGQLGNGTYTDSAVPIQVGNDSDWATAFAGRYHVLALKQDGSLWSWGYGTGGNLGIGSYVYRVPTPTQVGSTSDWSTIAATGYFTLAIKSDGTLWSWGDNGFGQLGNGTLSSTASPQQVGTDTDWASASSSYYHALALKENGSVWAWGYGGYGSLGTGSTATSSVPTQVGIGTDWQSVAAGFFHSVAVKNDGTLWAWGSNQYGQFGNGSYSSTPVLTPAQSGSDSDWSEVDTSIYHSLGIKQDDSRWAWGYNYWGQLGNGTTGGRETLPEEILFP